MKEWTPTEWDNLERQAAYLSLLLTTRERDQHNRAWQAKVRLTIETISMYRNVEKVANDI